MGLRFLCRVALATCFLGAMFAPAWAQDPPVYPRLQDCLAGPGEEICMASALEQCRKAEISQSCYQDLSHALRPDLRRALIALGADYSDPMVVDAHCAGSGSSAQCASTTIGSE